MASTGAGDQILKILPSEPHEYKDFYEVLLKFGGSERTPFLRSTHKNQVVSLCHQSIVKVTDDTVQSEDEPVGPRPMRIEPAHFKDHVPEVDPLRLSFFSYDVDAEGKVLFDEKKRPVTTSVEEAYLAEEQVARFIHNLVANKSPRTKQEERAVCAYLCEDIFKLPEQLPAQGSDEAFVLWTEISKYFVCFVPAFLDTGTKWGDIPRKPKGVTMTTCFDYPEKLYQHDPVVVNYKGPQDHREMFVCPKYICNLLHRLCGKLLTPDSIPETVKLCAAPDYDPFEFDYVTSSRTIFKRYKKEHPPPRAGNVEQWNTWAIAADTKAVFFQPCIDYIDAESEHANSDSNYVRPISLMNNADRSQSEIMFAKGNKADADGGGETTTPLYNFWNKIVYRTLATKFVNHPECKSNSQIVLGSSGRGRAGGGGEGSGGGGEGSRRRARGAEPAERVVRRATGGRVTTAELNTTIELLQTATSTLTSNVSELKTSITTLTDQNKALTDEVKLLTHKVQSYDETMTRVQREMDAVEANRKREASDDKDDKDEDSDDGSDEDESSSSGDEDESQPAKVVMVSKSKQSRPSQPQGGDEDSSGDEAPIGTKQSRSQPQGDDEDEADSSGDGAPIGTKQSRSQPQVDDEDDEADKNEAASSGKSDKSGDAEPTQIEAVIEPMDDVPMTQVDVADGEGGADGEDGAAKAVSNPMDDDDDDED